MKPQTALRKIRAMDLADWDLDADDILSDYILGDITRTEARQSFMQRRADALLLVKKIDKVLTILQDCPQNVAEYD